MPAEEGFQKIIQLFSDLREELPALRAVADKGDGEHGALKMLIEIIEGVGGVPLGVALSKPEEHVWKAAPMSPSR